MDYNFLFKMLLVGDTHVGKSSILRRYVDDDFDTRFINTVGIDFRVKNVILENNEVIKLQIWDTAGQERFRTITTSYYRGADGLLLVFDTTDFQSFVNVESWYNEIKRHTGKGLIIHLIGTKIDLKSKRKVSKLQAQIFADFNGLKYTEVSSKNPINDGINVINKIFNDLLSDIIEKCEPMQNTKSEVIMDEDEKSKKCFC